MESSRVSWIGTREDVKFKDTFCVCNRWLATPNSSNTYRRKTLFIVSFEIWPNKKFLFFASFSVNHNDTIIFAGMADVQPTPIVPLPSLQRTPSRKYLVCGENGHLEGDPCARCEGRRSSDVTRYQNPFKVEAPKINCVIL